MPPRQRLAAVIATGALVAACTGASAGSAAASGTTPSLPDLGPALTAAGVSSTSAATIASELTSLQATTPGGSLASGSLNTLDNALPTLSPSGLLTTVNTLVTTLENPLLTPNPAAAADVLNTISQFNQIAADPTSTAQAAAAARELSAALSTAGLGQILTDGTGLSPTQASSALSDLAGLQSLSPGASAGSLASVGTVLSALDTKGGVTTLSSDATALNGSSVTPAQLLTAISDLQGAASTLPAPLGSVATALANQLAASGSLFGGLASLGSPATSSTVSSAIGELSSLPALPSGSSIPAGGLSAVGTLLTALASQPGTTGLSAAATTLSSSNPISPSTLSGVITELQAASLPAPLDSTVNAITSQLQAAGSLIPSTGGTGGSTGGTGGSTGGTGGSTGGTGGSTGGTGGSTGGTTGGTGGSTGGTGGQTNTGTGAVSGHLVIRKARRHHGRLVLVLHCTASTSGTCAGTVRVRKSGHVIRKHVVVTGGHSKRLVLRLPHALRHGRLRIAARCGAQTSRRLIR